MMITEQSDTRLVFTQEGDERRGVAVIGAIALLALGGFFLFFAYTGTGRLFGYGFGALGVVCAALMFRPNQMTQFIFDTEIGDFVLRAPKPSGGRSVITVPLQIIVRADLVSRGNSHSGSYQQVDLVMHDTSNKPPLSLPTTFTGMSESDIHAAIEQWASRTNAFGPTHHQND